jgi:hypothetical protein
MMDNQFKVNNSDLSSFKTCTVGHKLALDSIVEQ